MPCHVLLHDDLILCISPAALFIETDVVLLGTRSPVGTRCAYEPPTRSKLCFVAKTQSNYNHSMPCLALVCLSPIVRSLFEWDLSGDDDRKCAAAVVVTVHSVSQGCHPLFCREKERENPYLRREDVIFSVFNDRLFVCGFRQHVSIISRIVPS